MNKVHARADMRFVVRVLDSSSSSYRHSMTTLTGHGIMYRSASPCPSVSGKSSYVAQSGPSSDSADRITIGRLPSLTTANQSGLAQRIGYDWIRCFEKTIGLLECDHLFPKRRNGLLIPTPFLIASCLKFLGLGLALFGIHTRIDYPCERSSYPADEGNHYRGDYSGPFGRLTDHLVNQPIQHRFFLSLSSCGLFVLQLQAYAAQGKDLIF